MSNMKHYMKLCIVLQPWSGDHHETAFHILVKTGSSDIWKDILPSKHPKESSNQVMDTPP